MAIRRRSLGVLFRLIRNRVLPSGLPANDAVCQMGDIAKPQLINKSIAKAGCPASGSAI